MATIVDVCLMHLNVHILIWCGATLRELSYGLRDEVIYQGTTARLLKGKEHLRTDGMLLAHSWRLCKRRRSHCLGASSGYRYQPSPASPERSLGLGLWPLVFRKWPKSVQGIPLCLRDATSNLEVQSVCNDLHFTSLALGEARLLCNLERESICP